MLLQIEFASTSAEVLRAEQNHRLKELELHLQCQQLIAEKVLHSVCAHAHAYARSRTCLLRLFLRSLVCVSVGLILYHSELTSILLYPGESVRFVINVRQTLSEM